MFKRFLYTINKVIPRASTRKVLPTFRYSHHQHGYQYNASYNKYIVLCPAILSQSQNNDNTDADVDMKDQLPVEHAKCVSKNRGNICGARISLPHGKDELVNWNPPCQECETRVEIVSCIDCHNYFEY